MNTSELIALITTITGGVTTLLNVLVNLLKTSQTKQKKSLTSQLINLEKQLAINKSNYEKENQHVDNESAYLKQKANLKYQKREFILQTKINEIKKQAHYEKEKNKLEAGLNNNFPNLAAEEKVSSSLEGLKDQGSEIVKKEMGKIVSSLKDRLGEEFGSFADKVKKQ